MVSFTTRQIRLAGSHPTVEVNNPAGYPALEAATRGVLKREWKEEYPFVLAGND